MIPRPLRRILRLTRRVSRLRIGELIAVITLIAGGFGLSQLLEQWDVDLPTTTSGPVTSGVVTHVRDGDTLEIGGISVRLLGVDTPEDQKRRRGTPWCLNKEAHAAATAAVESLTLGQHVTTADAEPDSSGRDMAARVILPDGRDLGTWLLEHNLAVTWPAASPATACPAGIAGGQEPTT